MDIYEVLWKDQFADKIEWKHHVTTFEVEARRSGTTVKGLVSELLRRQLTVSS